MASFLCVVIMGYWEYVKVAPVLWKTVFMGGAFTIYVASLVLGGVCGFWGLAFSVFVGACLGVIKIYAYSALCAPFVDSVLDRHKLAKEEKSRV